MLEQEAEKKGALILSALSNYRMGLHVPIYSLHLPMLLLILMSTTIRVLFLVFTSVPLSLFFSVSSFLFLPLLSRLFSHGSSLSYLSFLYLPSLSPLLVRSLAQFVSFFTLTLSRMTSGPLTPDTVR